jgi:hypothetical protein
MAHPQKARITCSECNSWYASESELWEHVQEVHRRSVPEQSTFERGDTSKEQWANLSVHMRNHVQVHFKSEELDAIDRFILLASQASVFDEVCR